MKRYTLRMASNPELTEIVGRIIQPFSEGPESLADMLNAIQLQLGYIPPSTIVLVAEKTQLSRPEVHRAVELSPSLALTPVGEHKLYICNAENCCMQGGSELMAFAQERLNIKAFQTTTDKKIRLESFQCLGNCSMSPNVMVDGRVYGLMDDQGLDKLIDNLYCDLSPDHK